MKLFWLMAAVVGLSGLAANAEPSPWEKPAAALAEQVAGVMGPGQARLTIRNLSSIPANEIPAIRRILEQDLKEHGIMVAGAESANSVRITLSENARERLWVAEVAEGDVTQVAMVHLDLGKKQEAPMQSGLMLRSQTIFVTDKPVLAVIERTDALVVLGPDEIAIYARGPAGWSKIKTTQIEQRRSLARDPRGVFASGANGLDFEALLPGTECAGSFAAAQIAGDWTVQCRASDDPWPMPGLIVSEKTGGALLLKAFYNASRNYFTGVVTLDLGIDLPPFYSAAAVERPASGGTLLVSGIDGKVQMTDNGALKTVAGTRDWGSDIAAVRSGCGAGMQIVAADSGEAANDSLRAYELPALEAVPASPPLAMNGTVTSLWSAPDGKSVLAVIRKSAYEYEVDRVTALCN